MRPLQDEPCPVSESLLGDLYRASPHGLATLVETIPPQARAMLAIYCYRRAHLTSIGLAIASTCEKDDLQLAGGQSGEALFESAKVRPVAPEEEPARRKVTLWSGVLRKPVVDDELEDEPA